MHKFRVKCTRYGASQIEEIIVEAEDAYDAENRLIRDGYKVISIRKL